MKKVKKPCIGCIYYAACGSSTRSEPCKGRVTKREKKSKEKREKRKIQQSLDSIDVIVRFGYNKLKEKA